jgi:hypothetical protein
LTELLNGDGEDGSKRVGGGKEETQDELEKEDDEKDAQQARTEIRIRPKYNPFVK